MAGATTDRKATATRTMMARTVRTSSRCSVSPTMRACSARAGTVPVMPTTWSSARPRLRATYCSAARCWLTKLLRGSMNRLVMTVVFRSLVAPPIGSALVSGSAPSRGGSGVVWSTARASSTDSAWTNGESPRGSRWTTDVRLFSGNPKRSTDRISAAIAGLSCGITLAVSLPLEGSRGPYTARRRIPTQVATTAQRHRMVHRA